MGDMRPGDRFRSRYMIKRELGRGGMGVVYEAVDELRGELPCAIKVLHAHREPDQRYRKRFRAELDLLTRLRHPNIVEVFEANYPQATEGTIEQSPFIVMELLKGQSLGDLLRSDEPLSLTEALRLIMQALNALERMHREGVVHRDLKPDNFFICSAPEHGQKVLKVLDFGVAKDLLSDTSLTASLDNAMIGTPRYMAPEQIQNGDVTAQSDLYALGVILFELIRGQRLFSLDQIRLPSELRALPANFKLTWLHLNVQAPSLNLDPELDQVIASMLAKVPEERPKGARELRSDLNAWLKSHPLSFQLTLPIQQPTQETIFKLGRPEAHEATAFVLEELSPALELDQDHDPLLESLNFGEPTITRLGNKPTPAPKKPRLIRSAKLQRKSQQVEVEQLLNTEPFSSHQFPPSPTPSSSSSSISPPSPSTAKPKQAKQHLDAIPSSSSLRQGTVVNWNRFGLITLLAVLLIIFIGLISDPQRRRELFSHHKKLPFADQLKHETLKLKRSAHAHQKVIGEQVKASWIEGAREQARLRRIISQDREGKPPTLQVRLYLAFIMAWLTDEASQQQALLQLRGLKLSQFTSPELPHLYGLTLLQLKLPKSKSRRQSLALTALKKADQLLIKMIELGREPSSDLLIDFDDRLNYYLVRGHTEYLKIVLAKLKGGSFMTPRRLRLLKAAQ